MSQFLAIDFETANDHKLSACSVGIVLFDKKNINGKFESLIRPPTNYDYLWRSNYNIHGISKNSYMRAKTFPQVWKSLQDKFSISSSTIVCHNAGFDMNILLELFLHYKISAPKFYYLDTINIAKLTWDSPNYRLSTLASRLRIPLNHHDALSDSLACVKIAMKSLNYHKEEDFNNILEGTRFGYGVLESKKNTPMGRSKVKSIKYKETTDSSAISMTSKFCSGCNKKRLIKDFKLDGRTSDGYSKLCTNNHTNKDKKTISTKIDKDINSKFEKIIETGLKESKYEIEDTSERVSKIINSVKADSEYSEKTKSSEPEEKIAEYLEKKEVEKKSIFKDIGFVYTLIIVFILFLAIFR